MNIRESLNKNPLAAGIGSATILALVLSYIFLSMRPGKRTPPTVDFVDETSLKHMLRPVSDVPPVHTSSGTYVIGHYETCTSCDETTRQLVYLEKYTDDMQPEVRKVYEAQNQGQAPKPEAVMNLHKGLLVRLPSSNATWYLADSKEGMDVMNSLKCPGEQVAIPCPP